MASKSNTQIAVVTNSVRGFRKELCRMARGGAYKPRLVGDRKSGYFVAVCRGRKAIVVSARFAFKQLAEAWSVRKFLQTPPTRTLALS